MTDSPRDRAERRERCRLRDENARLRATIDEVRDVWNNMASGELGHNAALVALGEALNGDTND